MGVEGLPFRVRRREGSEAASSPPRHPAMTRASKLKPDLKSFPWTNLIKELFYRLRKEPRWQQDRFAYSHRLISITTKA